MQQHVDVASAADSEEEYSYYAEVEEDAADDDDDAADGDTPSDYWARHPRLSLQVLLQSIGHIHRVRLLHHQDRTDQALPQQPLQPPRRPLHFWHEQLTLRDAEGQATRIWSCQQHHDQEGISTAS